MSFAFDFDLQDADDERLNKFLAEEEKAPEQQKEQEFFLDSKIFKIDTSIGRDFFTINDPVQTRKDWLQNRTLVKNHISSMIKELKNAKR
ncbi:hypothetical protein Ciccas_008242 [Cichlidogyrus casuarinus]|uniref:Uncharacterized protein n=1 Tax=Cichlidogyrus casuarinus TaxID=1844966 RepID=A0ABD2Q0J0_9PLAT